LGIKERKGGREREEDCRENLPSSLFLQNAHKELNKYYDQPGMKEGKKKK